MKKTFTKTTVLTGFPMALLCCLLIFGWTNATAQSGGSCENTSPYGTVTAGAAGSTVLIGGCAYAGSEYSTVSGISTGYDYTLTHENGSYITVRSGAVDGPIVSSGFSPLTFTASSTSDIYVHWTADAACTQDASGCYDIEIETLALPACENTSSYGSATAGATGSVTPVSISTCAYAGSEYSTITGMISGDYYEITHEAGSFVTVREGTVDGAVVANGYSPLQFTATSSSDVYVHWTADEFCTPDASGCWDTDIANLGAEPCENTSSYGSATAGATGVTVSISTCAYAASEYSTITGLSTGYEYTLTHEAGSYVTVREGAVDGPVVDAGFSPLTFTAASTSDVYVHWTVDAACTQDASGCWDTDITTLDLAFCENTSSYGSATAGATGSVTPVSISTCAYAGSEYSTITGMISGDYYEITHEAGSFVTVREGAVDGPVVASGYSPLQFTATSSSDVYVHWTADEFCTQDASGCWETDIANLGAEPCENTSSYGSATAGAAGVTVSISTCAYAASEYSTISGVLDGFEYELTHEAGSYVTVRSGAVDGPVIGAGLSPLTFTGGSDATVYVHWTVDDACTQDASGCYDTDILSIGYPPCENSTQWPTSAVAVGAVGAGPVDISTNQYASGEYSVLTSVASSTEYEIVHGNGSFITVRIGAVDGAVLASGPSPLTFVTTSTDDLYVHWNENVGCDVTGSGSFTTTVEALSEPCIAASGAATADEAVVCLDNGSATISVTPDGNAVIPVGYSLIGVLTDAAGNVLDGGALSYAVAAAGDYYIYVGVAADVDLGSGVYSNESTIAGIIALTIDGGGSLCGSIQGTGTLISVLVCPDNDLCADAEAISCGDVVAGTNVGATEQTVPTYNGFTVGRGVWYSFTGTGLDITLSVCDDATFDSEINIVTSTDCINYTNIAGNDDACTAGTSEVTFTSVAGQEYYAYVSDWNSGGSNVGTFNLTMTCATPANDDCAGATPLTVGQSCSPTAGDVAGATESMTGCTGTASDDIWFSFVATSTDITIDVTESASFDAVFEVFSGACGSLTSVECVDDVIGTGGTETTDLTGLTPGNTYYVRVYDWYAAAPSTTDFGICAYALSVGINDDLSTSLSVYPNPSNGQFVVEVNGVEADAQLTVMDVAGRTVYTEGVTMNGSFRKELNLEVAEGTYLLQISTVEGIVTRKIQIH